MGCGLSPLNRICLALRKGTSDNAKSHLWDLKRASLRMRKVIFPFSSCYKMVYKNYFSIFLRYIGKKYYLCIE